MEGNEELNRFLEQAQPALELQKLLLKQARGSKIEGSYKLLSSHETLNTSTLVRQPGALERGDWQHDGGGRQLDDGARLPVGQVRRLRPEQQKPGNHILHHKPTLIKRAR